MEKINLVSSIHHVDASLCVESSAPVCIMEPAVKNIAGRSNCYLIGIEEVCGNPRVMFCILFNRDRARIYHASYDL